MRADDESTIKMVRHLSKGALQMGIADYVDAENANGRAAYLDEDEGEYRCGIADQIKQLPYQDSWEYGINNQNAIQKVNTSQELAVPLVSARVIKAFINGLCDQETRTQVHLARPATLHDAIT